MTVAENIKRIREEFGVTQSELAKIAGVTEHTPSKWELGVTLPRMGAVEKISKYFNIPKSRILEDYITVTEKDAAIQRTFDRPEMIELLNYAMQYPREDVEMFLRVIKAIKE